MIAPGTPVIFTSRYRGTAELRPRLATVTHFDDGMYEIVLAEGEHAWAEERELIVRGA